MLGVASSECNILHQADCLEIFFLSKIGVTVWYNRDAGNSGGPRAVNSELCAHILNSSKYGMQHKIAPH